MSEHTPGPWKWGSPNRQSEEADQVLDSSNRVLAYDIPTAADAVLMAAAPDLLAALEQTEVMLERLRVLTATGDEPDWVQPEEVGAILKTVEAAITKATGK